MPIFLRRRANARQPSSDRLDWQPSKNSCTAPPFKCAQKNKFLKVLNVLQDFYSIYSTTLCTKNPTLPPWLLITLCISINLPIQEWRMNTKSVNITKYYFSLSITC